MAPDCRATSRPFRNAISVGMLRMPKRAAISGSASVSSFASRALRRRARAAACSYAGAIIRQGPHHGAQKSTTSGRSLRRDVAVEVRRGRARSDDRPAAAACSCRSVALPSRRSRGTRLVVSQCGHTTRRCPVMAAPPGIGRSAWQRVIGGKAPCPRYEGTPRRFKACIRQRNRVRRGSSPGPGSRRRSARGHYMVGVALPAKVLSCSVWHGTQRRAVGNAIRRAIPISASHSVHRPNSRALMRTSASSISRMTST